MVGSGGLRSDFNNCSHAADMATPNVLYADDTSCCINPVLAALFLRSDCFEVIARGLDGAC